MAVHSFTTNIIISQFKPSNCKPNLILSERWKETQSFVKQSPRTKIILIAPSIAKITKTFYFPSSRNSAPEGCLRWPLLIISSYSHSNLLKKKIDHGGKHFRRYSSGITIKTIKEWNASRHQTKESQQLNSITESSMGIEASLCCWQNIEVKQIISCTPEEKDSPSWIKDSKKDSDHSWFIIIGNHHNAAQKSTTTGHADKRWPEEPQST